MAPRWQIGDRIDNRWEIYRILRGGMGIVYVVYDHHPAFREAFAAKTFLDEVFDAHPVVADRFMREAITWLKIDPHLNVNHARMAGVFDGKPFLFTEYVSGGDLGRWIRTVKTNENLPQVMRFGIQFCDGMTHLLSQGIKVHRDIKPQNCLVTEDGNLKITDFGLAKIFDDDSSDWPDRVVGPTQPKNLTTRLRQLFGLGGLGRNPETAPDKGHMMSVGLTATGAIAGTSAYMAPEQFEDAKRVDARADIYSFGIMLFQMASGYLPFRGRTWTEFARVHKSEPPPSMDLRNSSLISIVDQCLAKDPNDRFQNFKVLREHLAETYRTLTSEDPPPPVTATELDSIQLFNRGVGLGDLGRPQEALTYYDRALVLNPSFSHALYNKGVNLAELGRYEQAIACYDRAIELNPRYDSAWANKGFALDEMGRTSEALACYDQALEIDPKNRLALSNKGAVLSSLGLQKEALAYFDCALAIDPQDSRALNNKGNALHKLNRNKEGLVCYDRSLELNPRYQKAWYNKATALLGLGRTREALECFDHALELDPLDSDSWINKGDTLCDLRRLNEGLACYDRALEINPEDAQGWVNKGATLGESGRLREALKCFREAERLGHPEASEMVALCRADPRHLFDR